MSDYLWLFVPVLNKGSHYLTMVTDVVSFDMPIFMIGLFTLNEKVKKYRMPMENYNRSV
jgi:hypothetical protein